MAAKGGRASTRERGADGRRSTAERNAAAEDRAKREGGRAVRTSARIGYVARGGFYAVLAYLTVRIALLSPASAHAARSNGGTGAGSGGRPANANGALSLLSQSLLGEIALGVAALGFLLLAFVRLHAAWRDHESGKLRRLSVAGQGALYLGLTSVPISYLAGNRSTGTEKQQRKETAQLLGIPGGAVLVGLIGAVVIIVCGWQLRGVYKQDFTDGMDLSGSPSWLSRVVHLTGTVGIAGRALVFLPIGIWLIITAFTFDPQNSRGLDSELLSLAGRSWGLAILVCIAVVLAVFAAYSFLEARYRQVNRSL
jgi:hypothetical protein